MISKLDANDHYEIVNLIAEGGMGAVYKAKKVGAAGFEKTVAIKMMARQARGDAGTSTTLSARPSWWRT